MRALTPWIGLLISCSALATSFYERPFPESVQDAPVIVRGKVGPSQTDWAQSGETRRIYTFWDLQITEPLKGLDKDVTSLKMREIGGEKDGVGMEVSGAAHFEPGEETVVFLGARNSDGTYDVWGMMMGKYSLQKDEGGSEYLVGPGINSLTQPQIGEGHGDTRGAKKWTLPTLRELIASQAAGAKESEKSVQKPNDIPSHSATPTSQAEPSEAANLAASQLQSSSSNEGSSPWPWVIGVVLLGFAAVWVIRRRS